MQTLFLSIISLACYWITSSPLLTTDFDCFTGLPKGLDVAAAASFILRPKPIKQSNTKAVDNQTKSSKHSPKKENKKASRKGVHKFSLPKSRRPTRIATARKPLLGTVFYLASGHGGPDPGAIGRLGRQLLPEDEYAYDVTIRLAQILKKQGAIVYTQ